MYLILMEWGVATRYVNKCIKFYLGIKDCFPHFSLHWLFKLQMQRTNIIVARSCLQ